MDPTDTEPLGTESPSGVQQDGFIVAMATSFRTAGQTYAMLGSSHIWQTAIRSSEAFKRSEVPHALVGGVAVCLHGYQRNTADVDILVRPDDLVAVRQSLERADFVWDAENRQFAGPYEVPVQLLIAGEPAGDDRSLGVCLPDPGEPGTATQIEGLSVISLAGLIEMKLACGLGNLRRTHRDLADVVELIIAHGLGRDFARQLHKSVRKEFRELVRRARGGH